MPSIYDDPSDILEARQEDENADITTAPRYYEEEDERPARTAPRRSSDEQTLVDVSWGRLDRIAA